MIADTDRRLVLVAIATGLAVGVTGAGAASPVQGIADLERRSGGRLGVYALDLGRGRSLSHRAGKRFKLQSSFKGLLTALVLHRVALGQERLDAPVRFGKSDLLAAPPVTTAHVGSGEMTVGALCAATMATGDNAAANLLLRRLGDPTALTSFLRSVGDPFTRADHYEGAGLATSPFPEDSTTPEAVTGTLRRILVGNVLPDPQREQWEAWMESNVVGRGRLRAAFLAGWVSGDRTGTSDGVCNDYAFTRRPGRDPLLVAAYYAAPALDLSAQEAVFRGVVASS